MADQGLIDSVANANNKTIAEAGAHSMAIAMQNAVSHQNRMNAITEAAVGNIVKRLTEMDVGEAVAVLRAQSGSGLDIGGIVAILQQLTKGAQTTPPTTA